MNRQRERFAHDPDSVLDYRWDWKSRTSGYGGTDWLADGETITSHTIVADAGITIDSSALDATATAVIAWVSSAQAGSIYNVTCQIETSQGRKHNKTIRIVVMEQ